MYIFYVILYFLVILDIISNIGSFIGSKKEIAVNYRFRLKIVQNDR